jgi:hypothetical protein
VLSCSVALLAGSAAVVVDGSLVSDAAVLEAVDDAGFEVELRGAEEEGAPARVTVGLSRLLLTSVSTQREADAAALLLAGCPGVLRAGSLARGSELGGAFTAEVEFAQEVTGPRTLLEALAAAGVTAALAPASKRSDADGARARPAAPQSADSRHTRISRPRSPRGFRDCAMARRLPDGGVADCANFSVGHGASHGVALAGHKTA